MKNRKDKTLNKTDNTSKIKTKKDISDIAKKTYLGKDFKLKDREKIKEKIKKQDENLKEVVLSEKMQEFRKDLVQNNVENKTIVQNNKIENKSNIIRWAVNSHTKKNINKDYSLNREKNRFKESYGLKTKKDISDIAKKTYLGKTFILESKDVINNNKLEQLKRVKLISPKIKKSNLNIKKVNQKKFKENIKEIKLKDSKPVEEINIKKYIRNDLNNIEKDLEETPTKDITSVSTVKSVQLMRNVENSKRFINSRIQRKELSKNLKEEIREKKFNRFERNIYKTNSTKNTSKSINSLSKEKIKNNFIKQEEKSKFIENTSDTTKQKIRATFSKLGSKIQSISKIKLILPILILIIFTSIFSGTGSIASPPSQMIMTTEMDNDYYLDKYREIKQRLQRQLDEEIYNADEEMENAEIDRIEHIGHNGVIEDINFLELMSFLAVIKEQEFEQKKDDTILEDLYSKMVRLDSRIEYQQTKETTIIIRVIEVKYFNYKEIMNDVALYYNFKNRDDEWVENLIESAMFVYPILDIPGNFNNSEIPSLSDEDINSYGNFFHPLNGGGRVSSEMGYRIHPITGNKKLHAGIDIGIPEGTPVYSAKDGVVIFAGWQNPSNTKAGYGLYIVIQHNDGTKTLYAHNSSLSVKVNDIITKGKPIARSGNTGASTGPHLHFEIRLNGQPVNPRQFLKF